MAYPGMCYVGVVDWLALQAASDSAMVDTGDRTAVADCLMNMGVPSGWLRLWADSNPLAIVHNAWVDGHLDGNDSERNIVARLLEQTDLMTSSGVTWGVAAWHVLSELAEARYG
jgi:hypothetical protein